MHRAMKPFYKRRSLLSNAQMSLTLMDCSLLKTGRKSVPPQRAEIRISVWIWLAKTRAGSRKRLWWCKCLQCSRERERERARAIAHWGLHARAFGLIVIYAVLVIHEFHKSKVCREGTETLFPFQHRSTLIYSSGGWFIVCASGVEFARHQTMHVRQYTDAAARNRESQRAKFPLAWIFGRIGQMNTTIINI